jgi:general secretion pathway protein H
VVAIIAMLAAVILPAMPHTTSRTRLEAYAIEMATLLRADRDAAIRRRTTIVTEISATSRSIKSGSHGHIVRLPADVHLDAVLAARCNGKSATPTISFFASGMSCGGTITVSRPGVGYQIRINWLTGGVEVVPT